MSILIKGVSLDDFKPICPCLNGDYGCCDIPGIKRCYGIGKDGCPLIKIPAADVRPVVLCRDCKHRFMTPNGWHCHYAEWGIEDDDFCSCGKKMEES